MTTVIERRGLSTVVAGWCVSACAMLFLAGSSRAFGDLTPPALSSLGFHASYANGNLASAAEALAALKERVIARTGGKIDVSLVDRWLHFTDERNTIRFRYPVAGEAGVYFCPLGRFPNAGEYANCTPIPAIDALSQGIITTAQIVHVNR